MAGNSTVDGSSTSENVVGPEVKLTSTFWPLSEPVKWNEYFPTAVGMKKASNSPFVPSPLSGSNDGSNSRAMVFPPASTETFSELPMSATGCPFASCRNIWTKFFSPR